MKDVVLVDQTDEGKSLQGPPPLSEAPDEGWKWIGWFGLLLAAVGLGDFFLTWFPLHFGAPEWEFGTVASSFSGLPLVTMGFAALLGSGVARGKVWLVWVMSAALLVFALLILALYLVFMLDVPIALRAVQGLAALGIKKAIVKTSLLGLGFSAGYFAAAIAAWRYLRLRNGVRT